MTVSRIPVSVQPGMGDDFQAFGNSLSVLLSGTQTGGKIAVMLETVPPGGGPPLHVHGREDEIFLVVEGRFSYMVEGRWTEVGPGGAVFLPKGAPHCFRNTGTTPGRHWILTLPAGFENFYAECALAFEEGEPPPEQLVAIHAKHGITLLG